MNILHIFIDGLGLNFDHTTNPILKNRLPYLQMFLSRKNPGLLIPTDASLEYDGLPQSATGQTALLTGVNPVPFVGGHRSGFPGPKLIKIIKENSILKRIDALGLKSTFANAYHREFSWENVSRASVTTYNVLSAGQKFRNLDDLCRGKAVYQEFTNEFLRKKGYRVPLWTPEHAGKVLVDITKENFYTLYEFFQTDIAGHKTENKEFLRKVLKNLDEFLGSVWENLPGGTTLLLTSDHGNIEDDSTRLHTTNPVPTFAYGPKADIFSGVKTLTDIVPGILKAGNKKTFPL